ncbi:HLA class II histocompatibility antigen, DRB1-11 beta chain-like, partial [Python bivittatus]|uniref:HLA class II histocompatibility antigen, DRB1-11 beta chain-like n=1 Tax=Python bivittatus TaxID=176946 RepID=A0A9F5J2U4_PYTBI
HFLYQRKSDCHFFNGTQRVRFLDRYFYDRQEYVRFDSDVGKVVAVTPLGQLSADYWDSPHDHHEAHFLHQTKSDCHFFNGTQRLRFLFRYFYDRQEFVRFDSDVGKVVAVTPLGQLSADYWNSRQDYLQDWRAAVDRCQHNYEVLQGAPVVGRRKLHHFR